MEGFIVTVKFLTRCELQRILSVARDRSARDHAMILIAYRHGLRASETCNLDTDAVDPDAARITCTRLKGSLTNWQRLEPYEVLAVNAWLGVRPQTAVGNLFVDSEGRPLSRFQFYRLFRRHAQAADIPEGKRHPHVLKHALGTALANAGVPVQVIQQRLGHRSISNTMIYLDIASEYVDRTVATAIESGAIV